MLITPPLAAREAGEAEEVYNGLLCPNITVLHTVRILLSQVRAGKGTRFALSGRWVGNREIAMAAT